MEQNTIETSSKKYEDSIIIPYDICDIRKRVDHLHKLLKVNPTNMDLLFKEGRLLCALGRYGTALEYFNKCIKCFSDSINPRNSDIYNNALFFKGYALKELGRFGDAEYWLKMFLTNIKDKKINNQHRHYHDALSNRGYALKELGRYKEALTCFNLIKDPDPYFHKNIVDTKKKEFILYYQGYLKLLDFESSKNGDKPDQHNEKDQLDQLNEKDKKDPLKEAEKDLLEFYTMNPDHPFPVFRLQRIWQLQEKDGRLPCSPDKRKEIKESFEKIDFEDGLTLGIFGNNSAAKLAFEKMPFFRGMAYFGSGEYKTARKYFIQCTIDQPNNTDILFNIGNTFRKEGNEKEAIQYFEKCLELDCNDRDALVNKGNALH